MQVPPVNSSGLNSEPAASVSLQAGFTVSSKHFKKAVDRNRIKRLMREAYRLQKHTLQQSILAGQPTVIFFIYVGKELPGYQLLFEKMTVVLDRLNKLNGEQR